MPYNARLPERSIQFMATKQNNGQEEKITALYGRLSDDDGVDMESNSISNQRTILQDYAKKNGYLHPVFFYDDGVSGTTFERPGFKEMEALVEAGKVSTIIVKDLSRFGRNYLEVGRFLEIVYPTLGVKFIAIQENVDTLAGTGTEMMPFHNIFNEWYASQTSKKIRAVWAMKAANGKRVSPTVPYGYVKDKDSREIWHIDEPAAEVVRHIFALCLSGLGPLQIAKQLEREQVLTPTAYFNSIGRATRNSMPAYPYLWAESTVENILANRQYTGCAVNFKSTTVSYKVHKTVYKPEEDWQIIPNMQEPIIDENTWLRVQELRQNKRRNAKTGRVSLFSGLLFCPDCGAKLHFCAAKSLKPNQEFYRCANYKDGRGSCQIHYIRNVVLEQIVLTEISELADFVRCYEPIFLYMISRKTETAKKTELNAMRQRLATARSRITEIDRVISRLYEDNILGKISDERFSKMSATYEAEQKTLDAEVSMIEQKLRDADKASVDLRMLLKGLREFTELKKLTPELVNTLIQRIEVHNSDRSGGKIRVKVDIYFTAIGIINLPTEKDMEKLITEYEEEHAEKERSKVAVS
jgi:DNA invertase Pin-like site-specific DNA recombinase